MNILLVFKAFEYHHFKGIVRISYYFFQHYYGTHNTAHNSNFENYTYVRIFQFPSDLAFQSKYSTAQR